MPNQVKGRCTEPELDWVGGCRIKDFCRPPDPGLSSLRVREDFAARDLALGGPGDGARLQTLPWSAGV